VNLGVLAVLSSVRAAVPELQIVHQTGERDLAEVRTAYARAGIAARVEPFLEAMAAEMRAADLVICRAGATTLAELAATGRPAVIVPLPSAADDHQRRNARVLVEAGAAAMVEEREFGEGRLGRVAVELLADPDRRAAMSAAMRRLARPDAASRIAARVQELAR
jgi:UDP-N-acetylglucosamine--N-acetylmuramyl-(pentapeptide) pyrophosphoryl-undecaprenol N-acetylglucosamine transferase